MAKFYKLLQKVALRDEDDDNVLRLPELYYVPYDKVRLVYSHHLYLSSPRLTWNINIHTAKTAVLGRRDRQCGLNLCSFLEDSYLMWVGLIAYQGGASSMDRAGSSSVGWG